MGGARRVDAGGARKKVPDTVFPDTVFPPHLNPVKAGLAKRPEDWPWSSLHDYTGNLTDAPATPSGLSLDRVWLPADPRPRICRRTATPLPLAEEVVSVTLLTMGVWP